MLLKLLIPLLFSAKLHLILVQVVARQLVLFFEVLQLLVHSVDLFRKSLDLCTVSLGALFCLTYVSCVRISAWSHVVSICRNFFVKEVKPRAVLSSKR